METSDARTYYAVLGVPPDADAGTIRKSYLRLSLQFHPDRNPPDRQEEAKARFVEIGEAYETLSDPARRAAYDRELRSGTRGGGWRSGRRSSSSAAAAAYADPNDRYGTYRDAFDAAVAGMSESDLNAAMGIAAALGGVIGSVVGSRLGKNGAGNGNGNGTRSGASSILSKAGSMMGSVVGSETASNLVRSLHEQSVERVTYEERRRAAVERGGPMPEPPTERDWRDVLGKTVDSVKGKASGMGTTSSRDRQGEAFGSNCQARQDGHSDSDKFKRAVETAFNVAGAFAELHAATRQSRR